MRLLRSLGKKNLRGKKCLVRINLDIKEPHRNSLRIQVALPTLRLLYANGAKPVVISHNGRPNGTDKTLSLKSAIVVLETILNKKLQWIENLRFDPREEDNDITLAKELAAKAAIYINDDFATSHRKAASLIAITKLLPSYAGLRLEEEITNLSCVRDNPVQPLVVVLGGIKLADKIGTIRFLEQKNAHFLLGSAYHLPREALPSNANITMPQDGIPSGRVWKDIGPTTTKEYARIISKAKTILWSGPVGNVENPAYVKGSRAIANAIMKSKAFSVAGGGDTADFLEKENLISRFEFVSTGGGAMLAFLAGEKMPALIALEIK